MKDESRATSPESPVAASIAGSSTHSTLPTVRNTRSTAHLCSLVAEACAQSAVALSRTVMGYVRHRPKHRSSCRKQTFHAADRNRRRKRDHDRLVLNAGPTEARTAATFPGLTAKMTASAPSTAAPLEPAVTCRPYFFRSSSARALVATVARSRSVVTKAESNRPRISASPRRPLPEWRSSGLQASMIRSVLSNGRP